MKSEILFEKSMWERGLNYVAGIDEAGRGPWAGPLSAGAVVITSEDQVVDGVTDSKKLNEKKRLNIFEEIINKSFAWGVGIVSPEEVDKLGITLAVNKAMILALNEVEKKIKSKADFLIIDGATVKKIGEYKQQRENKADFLYYSVGAASIIAKVTRDRIMHDYVSMYPEYGFDKHVGYGTKLHQEMLAQYGPTPIHRYSYRPIANLLNQNDRQKENWKYWGEVSNSVFGTSRIHDFSA